MLDLRGTPARSESAEEPYSVISDIQDRWAAVRAELVAA